MFAVFLQRKYIFCINYLFNFTGKHGKRDIILEKEIEFANKFLFDFFKKVVIIEINRIS